jgi:LCP family protein required for cell wall assembly
MRRGALVLGALVVAVLGWTGYRVWSAWHNVDRVPFDTETARENLPTTPTSTTSANDPLADTGPIVGGDTTQTTTVDNATEFVPNESLDAFLVLGSDQRAATGPSRRADVILLFLLPSNGGSPILTSIPRDLYISNPCTGGKSRVNANLNGCGNDVSGPEQMAIALENYTGINIDHFAIFDFEGFKNIVNRVGGVQICVDNAVMDPKTTPVGLDLPAGCSKAMGDQALAWVRSRHTKEFVNGVWRTVAGVNDLTRNQRQQDLIIQALGRLKDFGSITEFTQVVDSLSGDFAIDDGMSLSEAVRFAWSLRGLNTATIVRPVIPVANYVDPTGAYVLVPTKSFHDMIIEADPDAAGLFTETG